MAFSTERKRSQAESAYISLMGPGFSVVLVVVGYLAALALAPTQPELARYLLAGVQIVGLLNALNLLPLYPLDGGQALVAVAATGGPRAAKVAALAMAALLAALAFFLKAWMMLAFAVLGLAAALKAAESFAGVRPMSPATAALTIAAHLTLFAIHLFAWSPELLIWTGRTLLD